LEHGVGPAGVAAAQASAAARATRRLPQPALRAPASGRARRLPRPDSGAPVRREAARRGLLVLSPILAAIASGAGIYGLELAARHPGDALVWAHVGFSLLVCLLAVYKLAGIAPARLRGAWRAGRVLETTGSLLLAALLVPLLLSGIVVLVRPSGGSYLAYLHLIAGVWWTLLVAWHLKRYLARSLGALRISPARRTPPYRSLPACLRSGSTGRRAPHPRQRRDSRPRA
ncbi:MAG TPA: hypothetical protein VK781_06575, partial [Solirubrobacteraceae bacterium]|nr:hypothetical protein [Solirubrobacteraceae bacterium]